MEQFDAYRRRWFEHLRKIDGHLDREGPLRLPEQMGLRLLWGVESGQLTFPTDPDVDGRTARVLFAKLTNELLAFVGCARIGSLVGAWQHVRGVIETRATVHYLWLALPAERANRIKRYWTYLHAVGWLRQQELRNALDTETDDAKRAVLAYRVRMFEEAAAAANYAASDTDVDAWSSLFGIDVRKKPQNAAWYPQNHKITRMVRECDPSGGALRDYWLASHATHTSPLGARVAGAELRMIGYDTTLLPMAIDSVMGHAHFAARAFDRAIATELVAFVEPDLRELMAIRGRALPLRKP